MNLVCGDTADLADVAVVVPVLVPDSARGYEAPHLGAQQHQGGGREFSRSVQGQTRGDQQLGRAIAVDIRYDRVRDALARAAGDLEQGTAVARVDAELRPVGVDDLGDAVPEKVEHGPAGDRLPTIDLDRPAEGAHPIDHPKQVESTLVGEQDLGAAVSIEVECGDWVAPGPEQRTTDGTRRLEGPVVLEDPVHALVLDVDLREGICVEIGDRYAALVGRYPPGVETELARMAVGAGAEQDLHLAVEIEVDSDRHGVGRGGAGRGPQQLTAGPSDKLRRQDLRAPVTVEVRHGDRTSALRAVPVVPLPRQLTAGLEGDQAAGGEREGAVGYGRLERDDLRHAISVEIGDRRVDRAVDLADELARGLPRAAVDHVEVGVGPDSELGPGQGQRGHQHIRRITQVDALVSVVVVEVRY